MRSISIHYIIWRLRLRRKYYRMTLRGKKFNVAKTAIARELACFVWGIMTDHIDLCN